MMRLREKEKEQNDKNEKYKKRWDEIIQDETRLWEKDEIEDWDS